MILSYNAVCSFGLLVNNIPSFSILGVIDKTVLPTTTGK